MGTVRTTHFTTADLPPAKRFATWSAALPHYELALPPGDAPEDFRCEARVWLLGDLVLTRAVLPEVDWRRAQERIRADGVNTYNLLLLDRGTWIGTAAGRDFLIEAGQLGCFDLAQPFEGRSATSDSLSVTISRASLDRIVRTEPDIHGRVFSGAVGQLLTDYLLALERRLPEMSQSDVPAISRAALAQVAAAIEVAPSRPGGLPVDSLRHTARRYIERHLADRTLTPDRLSQDLGIPRSILYRSFKPLGGVAAYIQRRRLETAHVLLSNADELRSIAELAEDMGFSDPSHFAAAFRRAYDVTPRELRHRKGSSRSPGPDASDPTEQYRRWTGKLQGRSL